GPGQYRLSLNGTRTLERRVIAERGTRGNDDAGQFQFPDFRGTMLNRYDVDQFSFGLTTRYISKSMYEVNDQSLETREMPHVPEYWQHDLNISWFPSERYTVSLGVKNLTNTRIKHPVIAASHATSPHLTADRASLNNGAAYMDAIGRYYFVTFKANF